MILSKKGSESWLGAAMRFGALEGVPHTTVFHSYSNNRNEGFTEKRSAYLALAEMGIVDDADGDD